MLSDHPAGREPKAKAPAQSRSPLAVSDIALDRTLTIGVLVTTWPRLSQTFVLREVLGLERLGVRLRIFSVKVPTGEPVHAEVSQVQAPVTYLAFRSAWWPILKANLRLAGELGGLYFRTLSDGIRCIRYGNILHIFRQFLRAAYVADILRREPVDRIHAHFATAPASVAMFASEMTGIPYTIAVHANDIFVKARGKLLNAKLARAEAIVANNEHNRQYLLSQFGTQLKEKLPCIYNGLDLTQFKFRWPRAQDGGPPVVLSVGRLVPKKGFSDLIFAAQILCDRNRRFRMEIIGAGPLKDELLRQIEGAGLQNCVQLLGAQDQETVRSRYERAAVFVLPCVIAEDGDRDGIPNVLFEAMATGASVISTTVSAIPELIDSERNGLLVTPGDSTALADAIDRLLLSPTLRDQLARSARETIEARFTIARTSEALLALFKTLDSRRVATGN